jgi:hypothetical protein
MRIVDRLDDIVRFYGVGLSIPVIAKVMGFSEGGVYKVLTQAGIHRPGTKKQRLKKHPGCLRKRTLWTQDLGELGWIAMCDPQDCGFVWYRRNGPPDGANGKALS